MKTPWALLAVCSVAGGCSREAVAPPPPAPVNWTSLQPHSVPDASAEIVSENERALADAYAAALASPAFGPLVALLDEDVHFASPGADDAHGRQAVVQAHASLFGAFDDRVVTPSRVWRTPGEQTVEWTLSGTQARDWMGVPASRKSVSFKGLSLLWTKDDGSITDVHVYLNTAVVKAQFGVGPKELLSLPPAQAPTGKPAVFEQSAAGAYDEKSNVAAVKSALDALENNDEAGYVGAMTADLEVDTLSRAEPARGTGAAKAYFRAMHKSIAQLDTTVQNAWGVAQFAIVEYSIAGEQLGPIDWIPIPTQRDKVIRFDLVDICEVREGKIARIWRYDNPAQMARGEH